MAVQLSNRIISLAVVLALLVSALPLAAQESTQGTTPAPTQPESTTFLSFVGMIDSGSINNLLRIVNDQVQQRQTKHIVLLISSPGGDTTAAFAAYNVLRNVKADLTTFNIGNVDSAAMLLFCAGKERYALQGTRFLIHGNSFNPPPNMQMDSALMDAQLQQLKSLNQMVIRVVSETAKKKDAEIEAAVHSQAILTPEQAKVWGIVQEVKDAFSVPTGASMISVSSVVEPELAKKTFPFSSLPPGTISNKTKH